MKIESHKKQKTFCDLETYCSVVYSFSFQKSFFLFEGTSDFRYLAASDTAMYRWTWVMKVALGLISCSHYYEANTHPHPSHCAGSELFTHLFVFCYTLKLTFLDKLILSQFFNESAPLKFIKGKESHFTLLLIFLWGIPAKFLKKYELLNTLLKFKPEIFIKFIL